MEATSRNVWEVGLRALLFVATRLGDAVWLPIVDGIGVAALERISQVQVPDLGIMSSNTLLARYRAYTLSQPEDVNEESATAAKAAKTTALPVHMRWTLKEGHAHPLIRLENRSASCDLCGQSCRGAAYACLECDFDLCAYCVTDRVDTR